MDAVYQRCCGLDVHQKRVTACVITPEGQEVRSFSAMTKDLLALADWLASHRVTQMAMESTGVYWKLVYNILGGGEVRHLSRPPRLSVAAGAAVCQRLVSLSHDRPMLSYRQLSAVIPSTDLPTT